MRTRVFLALALAIAVAAALATTASATGKGQAFVFRGELAAASSTAVQIQIEGGNHAALKTLLGQAQTQTFAVDSSTSFLIWTKGIPATGSAGDLHVNDWVQITVRAKHGSTIAEIAGTPAAVVGDHRSAVPGKTKPLFLYRGTVSGAQSGGHVALHVTGGNSLALRTMLNQPADQSFAYGDDTIFLLWQGRVPTLISASQLKAGDRITVRVRAPRISSLAQVEQTPAKHVGDHEPANAPDKA